MFDILKHLEKWTYAYHPNIRPFAGLTVSFLNLPLYKEIQNKCA